MTARQIAGVAVLFAAVILFAAAAGVGAAWVAYGARQAAPAAAAAAASTQPPTTQPSGPTTRPQITEPAEGVTLTGKAICGSCFLNTGPVWQHHVVLETEEPYRTFLLAENERLEEIEAITGSCAAGDVELTAMGDVLVVNGQNVLVVRSFTHRAIGANGGE